MTAFSTMPRLAAVMLACELSVLELSDVLKLGKVALHHKALHCTTPYYTTSYYLRRSDFCRVNRLL